MQAQVTLSEWLETVEKKDIFRTESEVIQLVL